MTGGGHSAGHRCQEWEEPWAEGHALQRQAADVGQTGLRGCTEDAYGPLRALSKEPVGGSHGCGGGDLDKQGAGVPT